LNILFIKCTAGFYRSLLFRQTLVIAASLLWMFPPANAQDAQELAKKLSNPIASLISLPFQLNYDKDLGADDDGYRVQLNIQPVLPISISQDWNLISRTILPVVYQDDIFADGDSQFGLGDTVQSLFFSPVEPTAGGLIWGVGPVLLIPTATENELGADQWGAGPTAVGLKQAGPWTYGALANHLWSFAGDDDRGDISATFLQPFLTYTTPDAWTFGFNSESSYDWEAEEWSVPINFQVSKLLTVGAQPISIQGGLRYWADSPDNGPEGLGLRFSVTLLFPK
jgi:hypothetical protein